MKDIKLKQTGCSLVGCGCGIVILAIILGGVFVGVSSGAEPPIANVPPVAVVPTAIVPDVSTWVTEWSPQYGWIQVQRSTVNAASSQGGSLTANPFELEPPMANMIPITDVIGAATNPPRVVERGLYGATIGTARTITLAPNVGIRGVTNCPTGWYSSGSG